MNNQLRERLDFVLTATEHNLVERMRLNNIKGKRDNPYFCPLARYVRDAGGTRVYADNSLLYVYDEQAREDIILPYSNALISFIGNFDRGKYPELENTGR